LMSQLFIGNPPGFALGLIYLGQNSDAGG